MDWKDDLEKECSGNANWADDFDDFDDSDDFDEELEATLNGTEDPSTTQPVTSPVLAEIHKSDLHSTHSHFTQSPKTEKPEVVHPPTTGPLNTNNLTTEGDFDEESSGKQGNVETTPSSFQIIDRTAEFFSLLPHSPRRVDSNQSTSLFLLKAKEVYKELLDFARLLENSYNSFVGSHRHLPLSLQLGTAKNFTDNERQEFTALVTQFIRKSTINCGELLTQIESHRDSTSRATAQDTLQLSHLNLQMKESELFELQSKYDDKHPEIIAAQLAYDETISSHKKLLKLVEAGHYTNSTASKHYDAIVQSVYNLHKLLIRRWNRMQRDERNLYTTSTRLFASSYASIIADEFSTSRKADSDNIRKDSHNEANRTSPIKRKVTITNSLRAPIKNPQAESSGEKTKGGFQGPFSQRYIDELGPASRLQQYERFAASQKDSLLREAKTLQKQFADELIQGFRVEAAVADVASMINQFTEILESQSMTLASVEENAMDTTESMLVADQELLTTLQRTQKQQWTMIIIINILSIILICIHFLSP